MAETQDQPKWRTYRGSCHCGDFIYEIDLPEVKTIIDCDCSFCALKGNLYVITNEGNNFKVIKGSEEKLTSYTFGPRTKIHKVGSNTRKRYYGCVMSKPGEGYHVIVTNIGMLLLVLP
jgi:hypothetical protein